MTTDEAITTIATIYELSVVGGFTTGEINKELNLHVTDEDIRFFVDHFEAPLRLMSIEEKY